MGVRHRSVLSREPLAYAIAAQVAGDVWVPTEGVTTVAGAYLASPLAAPEEADWKAGVFEVSTIGTVAGLVMVGPGTDVALTRGTWYEWVRVDDPVTGARPVVMVGSLIIE